MNTRGSAAPARNSAPSYPAQGTLDMFKDVRGLSERRKAENLLAQIRRLANEFKSSEDDRVSCTDLILRKILFRSNSALRVLRLDPKVVIIHAPKLPPLPKVPPPYGFKGGAARMCLETALHPLHKCEAPRDIDLVRISANSDASLEEQDEVLAAQFMPEDLAHGHGVEVRDSFESYLATRDLTINEVLVIGGAIICSPDCIKDYFAKVLRPSTQYATQGMNTSLTLKMLRFAAERAQTDDAWHIAGNIKTSDCSAFDLCLQLSRALATGTEVASQFLALVQAHGKKEILPRHISDPRAALIDFGGIQLLGTRTVRSTREEPRAAASSLLRKAKNSHR